LGEIKSFLFMQGFRYKTHPALTIDNISVETTDWENQKRKLQSREEQEIHSGFISEIRVPDHNE
jgi:hypothetical protein